MLRYDEETTKSVNEKILGEPILSTLPSANDKELTDFYNGSILNDEIFSLKPSRYLKNFSESDKQVQSFNNATDEILENGEKDSDLNIFNVSNIDVAGSNIITVPTTAIPNLKKKGTSQILTEKIENLVNSEKDTSNASVINIETLKQFKGMNIVLGVLVIALISFVKVSK